MEEDDGCDKGLRINEFSKIWIGNCKLNRVLDKS